MDNIWKVRLYPGQVNPAPSNLTVVGVLRETWKDPFHLGFNRSEGERSYHVFKRTISPG